MPSGAAPEASPFLAELAWRGLLYQRTAEAELDLHLTQAPRTAYCGFDPTAPSLTIGNLVPMRLLAIWQSHGHKPLVLMGGGTGLIGDPSGKDDERPLLSREAVEAHVAAQRPLFERVLDFDAPGGRAAEILNNVDWLGKLGFLEVLRDVGKHFSVNAMIQREAVRERLHARGHGISYTEFSYALLQAYDFLHLRRERECTLQVAGSDQYGNIVSGIDLIRRTLGPEAGAFGVTAPLVTRSDGKKMGKSEQGAVWLSAELTSPYAFYQYWLNVPDADVASFLRVFAPLPREAIDAAVAEHEAAPEKRHGQRRLAEAMTDLIHGADERRQVQAASEAVFGGGALRAIEARALEQVVAELPRSRHARDGLGGEGVSLVELLPETSLASSRREARQFLDDGAVALNGERVDLERRIRADDLLAGRFVLLRRGKKRWHATEWE